MRALVTGCAGFIGSHLCDALLAGGDAVVGVDCLTDNYPRAQKLANLGRALDWDSFEFVERDLAEGDLAALAADCDAVFHLAAEPGVRQSWGDAFPRYVRNNILSTQRLLDAFKRRPEVRFVYASSSSVYGEAAVRPTPEDAPTRPQSPYAQTKLSGEQLCALYRSNYGSDTVSLRYFTVFGPRQRPDMAIHAFCRAALAGRELTVYGDGRQTRDFTYVADAVAATVAAGRAALEGPRAYNVGGGSPATLRALLEVIEELAGARLSVRYLERKHGDVDHTAGDTTRARAQLGLAPRWDLTAGIAAEYEWLVGLVRPVPGARVSAAT